MLKLLLSVEPSSHAHTLDPRLQSGESVRTHCVFGLLSYMKDMMVSRLRVLPVLRMATLQAVKTHTDADLIKAEMWALRTNTLDF